MAVTGIPTTSGLSILSGSLKSGVKKFALYGTSASTTDVPFSESSTISTLSSYLVGTFDVSRAYFDQSGVLTFECPIPYNTDSTKWVGACGLIYEDPDTGAQTLVSVTSLPKFQKIAGIGGTVIYKVPIAGTAGSPVFGAESYATSVEVDERVNELFSGLSYAIGQAGLANKEAEKTRTKRIQSGVVTIKNRGVIKGCVVSKSTTATRNLSLSNGTAYLHGRIISVKDLVNTATVPENTDTAAKTCTAYLWVDTSGSVQMDCTALGAAVPDGAIALYTVTVPAGSTEGSDQYLASCTLTDIRVIEANYPKFLSNAPFVYVALPFDVLGTDYSIELDVMEFSGGGYQMGYVYPGARASNGFSIYMNGTADSVSVRWTVKKTNL
jgi:hypothetical protein